MYYGREYGFLTKMDLRAIIDLVMSKTEKKTGKNRIINSFFSVFVVITAYILCRMIKQSPSMPKVIDMAKSAVQIFSSANLYVNALYTIKIVFIGVIVSLALGFVIAVTCSMNDVLNAMVMPIINCTKNIPSITLFPLFIVLMGIGDLPRVSIIIWNSIYPIISSTMLGLNSVDKEIVEAGENCGATKFQMYFYIKIPLALLNVLNGFKISLSNGFIAIVVAEMLGATKGLGYMVLWSANAFQYPNMYVYILIIALIGFSINVVIEKLIKVTERKVYYESKKKYCCNGIDAVNDSDVVDGMRTEKDRKGSVDVLCRTEGV